jgi:hypothetical protein
MSYIYNVTETEHTHSGVDIMSNSKMPLFTAVILLTVCGFGLAYDIPNPNFNNDGTVDFLDFRILANNWQQTGAGLVGDFDDSNSVDVYDLMVFGWYWLTEYSEYQQCEGMGTDLDADGIIAFEDMSMFAQNWLETGAGLAGDFDDSNSVDYNDLMVLMCCWLKGTRPLSIWEQFKAALVAGDIDLAVSYFADFVADDYRDIFYENADELQNMVNNMGDLSLEYIDRDIAVYEISNAAGTKFYPVVFTQEDNGSWKIAVF